MPQPRLFAQIAAGADRHGAAEQLRQGEHDRTGDAPAAGEARNVGAVRVDRVVAAHIVEHVEDNADALLTWTVVARTVRPGEENPLLLADALEALPPRRVIVRRHEEDERQRLLILRRRDEQLVGL